MVYIFIVIIIVNSPSRPNHECLFDVSLEANEEYIVNYQKIEIPDYTKENINEDDERKSRLFEIVETNRKILKKSLNHPEIKKEEMNKENESIKNEDIVVNINLDENSKEDK